MVVALVGCSPDASAWLDASLRSDYLADLIQQAEDEGWFGCRGQRQVSIRRDERGIVCRRWLASLPWLQRLGWQPVPLNAPHLPLQPLDSRALAELEMGAPSLQLLPPDVRERQLSKAFLKVGEPAVSM